MPCSIPENPRTLDASNPTTADPGVLARIPAPMSPEGGVQTVRSAFKSEPIWIAACPGLSASALRLDEAAPLGAVDARPRPFGDALPQDVQLVQDEQGGGALAGVETLGAYEDTDSQAWTTHHSAVNKGMTGPYPWRQPV